MQREQTSDLQALIERAYAKYSEEAAALQRLVEAFEPPTEREKGPGSSPGSRQ
jgi:hypothetical protein